MHAAFGQDLLQLADMYDGAVIHLVKRGFGQFLDEAIQGGVDQFFLSGCHDDPAILLPFRDDMRDVILSDKPGTGSGRKGEFLHGFIVVTGYEKTSCSSSFYCYEI